SIRRILTSDLGVTRKKKLKTHTLTPEQCQQRLDRGPGFLQYLTPRKLRYIFTFDETWITTDDLDGQTDFYYEREKCGGARKLEKNAQEFVAKTAMVVMGICWRGNPEPTSLRGVLKSM